MRPHHSGLRPDAHPVVEDAGAAEEGADLDENVVAHRLAGERSARGPECHVPAAAARPREELADLAHAAGPDDGLGDRRRSRRRRTGRGGRSDAREHVRREMRSRSPTSPDRQVACCPRYGDSGTGTWKR